MSTAQEQERRILTPDATTESEVSSTVGETDASNPVGRVLKEAGVRVDDDILDDNDCIQRGLE